MLFPERPAVFHDAVVAKRVSARRRHRRFVNLPTYRARLRVVQVFSRRHDRHASCASCAVVVLVFVVFVFVVVVFFRLVVVVFFFYVVVVLFQRSNFNAPLFSFSKPFFFFFCEEEKTKFFLGVQKGGKKKDLRPKYAQSILGFRVFSVLSHTFFK